jgi:hypothetical protein
MVLDAATANLVIWCLFHPCPAWPGPSLAAYCKVVVKHEEGDQQEG